MSKKYFALILIPVLILSLAGCERSKTTKFRPLKETKTTETTEKTDKASQDKSADTAKVDNEKVVSEGENNKAKTDSNDEVKVITDTDKTDEPDKEVSVATTSQDEKEPADEIIVADEKSLSPGSVAITSPNEGKDFITKNSYVVIRGSTPANTSYIKINDFKLTKYIPQSTSWNYIASTGFKTLKLGENTYTVKAYGSDDSLIGEASTKITYDADAAELPAVGFPNLLLILLGLFSPAFSLAVIRRKK